MKKYLFGLIAVCFAIGFAAFTTPKKSSAPLVEKWFVYDYANFPGDLVFRDPTDLTAAKTPARYVVMVGDPCPDDVQILCAIKANSNGLSPEAPLISGQTVETKLNSYFTATTGTKDANYIQEKAE